MSQIKQSLHFRLFIASLLFAAHFSGCSGSEGSGEIVHPVKEYMPHHNEIIQTGKAEDTGQSSLPEIVSRIEQAPKLFTIGAESEKQVEVFGDITALVTDSEQNIYILDNRTTSIRKYDKSGNLLSYYGGIAGKGPTDLFRPTDIEIVNDRIYVADGFNYVKILQSTEDGIEYEGAIQTPKIIPSDLCILEDKLYIRTIAENKSITDSLVYNLVHVYSLEDHTYQGAFGDLYDSPQARTKNMLSGGFGNIACIESTNTIVYSFDSFGYLYGYSPEGKFKWVTELVPFEGRKITETVQGDRSVRWNFKTEGAKISSIQMFNQHYLLAQARFTEQEKEPIIFSYILSSLNGRGYYLGNSFPWLIHKNEDFAFTRKVENEVSVDVMNY